MLEDNEILVDSLDNMYYDNDSLYELICGWNTSNFEEQENDRFVVYKSVRNVKFKNETTLVTVPKNKNTQKE